MNMVNKSEPCRWSACGSVWMCVSVHTSECVCLDEDCRSVQTAIGLDEGAGGGERVRVCVYKPVLLIRSYG